MNIMLRKNKNFVLLAVLLLAVFSINAFGQRKSEEEMKKIQDAKIAIITNRVNLTQEQSADFWPLYNEFSNKKRQIHREQRKIIGQKKLEGMTDEQVLNGLKEIQELKQNELNIEKEYQGYFLKIISASQVAELYKAEKTFNDMLLQRLKQRRE